MRLLAVVPRAFVSVEPFLVADDVVEYAIALVASEDMGSCWWTAGVVGYLLSPVEYLIEPVRVVAILFVCLGVAATCCIRLFNCWAVILVVIV